MFHLCLRGATLKGQEDMLQHVEDEPHFPLSFFFFFLRMSNKITTAVMKPASDATHGALEKKKQERKKK